MDLVAKNLTLRVGEQYHLEDVSFGMRKGEIYTLLGRTLSGKTTLLKMIAGLISPDDGRIIFDGYDLSNAPVWKRNIAMVYQQFINYPHLSVFDNIAFPLKQKGMLKSELSQRVEDAIATVGLEGFEERRIQELSGGQQQRVALARSLAKRADILLLDEPLVNLDYKLREQLREEFAKLFRSDLTRDSILIYASVKDGSIVINENIKFSLPEYLERLQNDEYLFGVRAGDIFWDEKGFEFEIELAEISGSETFLHAKNDALSLVCQLNFVGSFSAGNPVKLNFDTTKLYVFKQDGSLLTSPYQEV
ncbi:MAG: ATP-binding cassette domain-containing protein [Rhodobacteraceae bacterium]|nr:ATP-binding cassette domain-containing protein [Paracoccaceae bacterium]